MGLAGTVALESNGSPQGITRHETELSAGTIEYEDSGGEGRSSCCCTGCSWTPRSMTE